MHRHNIAILPLPISNAVIFQCILWLLVPLFLQTSVTRASPSNKEFKSAALPQSTTLELVGSLSTPALYGNVTVDGKYAYVAGRELAVIDIATPSRPVKVGALSLPAPATSVAVSNGRVYVGLGYEGWTIVDVSSPTDPREVGQYRVPLPFQSAYDAFIHRVAVVGNIVYLATDGAGLRIVNVSNPHAPRELGDLSDVYDVWDVVIIDHLAYLAAYERGLLIVDVGAPSQPVEKSSLSIPNFLAYSIAVADGMAFLSYGDSRLDGDRGLWIVDVTNPGAPTEIGLYTSSPWFGPLAVANNVVYISGESGIGIVDVSDPHAPVEIASDSEISGQIFLVDDYIYVADGGLSIYRLSRSSNSISGRVTGDSSSCTSGVILSAGSNRSTTTDSNGNYVFASLPGGTYTLTPSKSGCTFSPPSRTVTVPPGATSVNFAGTRCSANQWYGEYYINRELQGLPAYTRCDEKIDFFWGEGAPYQGGPTNNFSVRWTRTVEIAEAGGYRFRAFTDDGLRLYVDGEKVIDDWTARAFAEQSALKYLFTGSHQVTMEYVEWSNDAIAHLTWYQCRNGADDCSMNITPMYQTLYPDVPMPTNCSNWQNERPHQQSFYNYGCLVTSFAMALEKYGVDTTPTELNEWLSQTPGAYPIPCNGGLNSAYIPAFAYDWGKQHGKEIILKLRQVANEDPYKLVRQGTPLIMKVSSRDHYFLAVDVATKLGGPQTFGVNDPWSSYNCDQIQADGEKGCASGPQQPTQHETALTDPYLGNYSSITYLEETPTVPASLGFSVSGAEVLITDSQGHRTGFDPATQQILREIPESIYLDTKVTPPGGTEDGSIQRNLILADNAAGNYTLHVIGVNALAANTIVSDTTSFSISVVGFDSQFAFTEKQIVGTVSPGQIVGYQISFDPGRSLNIGSQVFLPLVSRSD